MSNPYSWLPPQRVIDRLMSNYKIDDNGCWISGYSSASHGYAQIGWQESGQRFLWLAHKVSWVGLNGPVPEGFTLDHTCPIRNRKCINPEHLRVLTNLENSRRINGRDFPLGWICHRNHDPSNLRPYPRKTKSGGVRTGLTCAECVRIAKRAYQARKNNKHLID